MLDLTAIAAWAVLARFGVFSWAAVSPPYHGGEARKILGNISGEG